MNGSRMNGTRMLESGIRRDGRPAPIPTDARWPCGLFDVPRAAHVRRRDLNEADRTARVPNRSAALRAFDSHPCAPIAATPCG